MLRAALLALSILTIALAGCASPEAADVAPQSYVEMGFDGTTWPRLDGVTLTVLDHGAFGAFEEASARFEQLTGARVQHVEAGDAGSLLQRAVLERGNPTFDVLYGLDNVLHARAVEAGVFEPYRPLLADRVAPELVFFDGPWHATPVDHAYVAVNVDPRHPEMRGVHIETLDDVRDRAGLFVTQDPRTSTPGLGFLLATIATYPEGATYDWKAYWRDLFAGGVLVTSGWTEAYEQRFSGGYGAQSGGLGDKPIVTSYSTSPAYEHHFGREQDRLARVVVAPQATFHQVETMGIAKGTRNLAAAQAWIEFSLTDAFQQLVAPGMAVYPVVRDVDVSETFAGLDPAPGTFTPAAHDADTLGARVESWVAEWVALCEAARCA